MNLRFLRECNLYKTRTVCLVSVDKRDKHLVDKIVNELNTKRPFQLNKGKQEIILSHFIKY